VRETGGVRVLRHRDEWVSIGHTWHVAGAHRLSDCAIPKGAACAALLLPPGVPRVEGGRMLMVKIWGLRGGLLQG
jgi:hypothetical protein